MEQWGSTEKKYNKYLVALGRAALVSLIEPLETK